MIAVAQNETILPVDFGKDHWSLLAYVECCAVDSQGILDIARLRVKNSAIRRGWDPEYGTRLRGYWRKDGTQDRSRRISDHDDLDCLEDLERAGWIENYGSGINPAYTITDFGKMVCAKLRQHKMDGGNFADFSI